MSGYSEMIGSFIRTGNYPIEANYVFESEEALKAFYNDPINKTTLHNGLLKVVRNEDSQSLYWVIGNEDNLEFQKLIDNVDIESIKEQLYTLLQKLNQEIEDRENSINDIYGEGDIPEDLDNLYKISNTIQYLVNNTSQINDQLKAVVGTEEQDIVNYLKTLDYKNITEISENLHKFLNTVDSEDTSINTFLELQEFLKGFEYTHSLYQCFVDFWNNIQGSPLPNSDFRTLRGIQDFIQEMKSSLSNNIHNLQTELDQTQIGVGLSGDGSYNADKETHYLQDATSVMSALRILDSVLYQKTTSSILKDGYYDSTTEEIVLIFNTSSGSENIVRIPVGSLIREWDVDNSIPNKVVELTREEVINGADRLSADVRISQKSNNILEKDGNSLYVSGSSDSIQYNGKNLTQSLNEIEGNLENKAPINSPIFTGIPQVEVSPDLNDSSQRIPSTNWVQQKIAQGSILSPEQYWLILNNE